MKSPTRQNPGQHFVAQDIIKIVNESAAELSLSNKIMSRYLKIEPKGYCRHEKEFDFYVLLDKENVIVTNQIKSSIQLKCKTLNDDFENGCGQVSVSGFEFNEWDCEYIRLSWGFSDCSVSALIQKDFIPISVDIKISGYGIKRESGENKYQSLCMKLLTDILDSVYNVMHKYKDVEEYVHSGDYLSFRSIDY